MKDTLKSFLEAWKEQDYDKMHKLCQKTYKVSHTKNNLKALLPNRIKSYKIISTEESNEVVHDAVISVRMGGKTVKGRPRLVCETEPFKASIDGEWGINPISIFR